MRTTFCFDRTGVEIYFRLYRAEPSPSNLGMLRDAVQRWGKEMRRPLVTAITLQEIPLQPNL